MFLQASGFPVNSQLLGQMEKEWKYGGSLSFYQVSSRDASSGAVNTLGDRRKRSGNIMFN